jgi:hypothetical protein
MRAILGDCYRLDRDFVGAEHPVRVGVVRGRSGGAMQAAMAFAVEGAQMLASNTAAQQELMNVGMALIDIATGYGNMDDAAASTLVFGAAAHAARQLGAGSVAGLGGGVGGLAGAASAPGALGAAATSAPPLANFAETPIATGAAGTGGVAGALGNVANVGSAAMGAGTAPLSAVQGAQSGSTSRECPRRSSTTKRKPTPRVRTTRYPASAVCKCASRSSGVNVLP